MTNSIGGSGSLVVNGNGAVTLTPATSNSYGGGTYIAKGTLRLGNNTALPTGTALTLGGSGASARS